MFFGLPLSGDRKLDCTCFCTDLIFSGVLEPETRLLCICDVYSFCGTSLAPSLYEGKTDWDPLSKRGDCKDSADVVIVAPIIEQDETLSGRAALVESTCGITCMFDG